MVSLFFPPAVVDAHPVLVLAVCSATLSVPVYCLDSPGTSASQRAVLGGVFGATLAAVASRSLVPTALPVWLAVVPLSAAVWALWAAAWVPGQGLLRVFLALLAFSGAERLRAEALFGVSWMGLWAPFAGHQWAAGLARVASREAVTWVVLLAAVAVARTVFGRWWQATVLLASAAAAVALPAAVAPPPFRPVTVGVVQVDLPRGVVWHPAHLGDVLGVLARATTDAAGAGARLVVWPENAVTADPARVPAVLWAARHAARQAALVMYTLSGRPAFRSLVTRPDRDYSMRRPAVASLIVDAGGALAGGGWKSIAFPFGELGLLEGTPGRSAVLRGVGVVGEAACLEPLSQRVILAIGRKGAQILAVGASFSVIRGAVSWAYLAHVRVAASELGIPAAVSVLGGPAAVISPTGQVVAARLSPGTGFAVGVVPMPDGPSGGPLVGLLLGWAGVCVLVVLLALLPSEGRPLPPGWRRGALFALVVPPLLVFAVIAMVYVALGAVVPVVPVRVLVLSAASGVAGWLWCGPVWERVLRRAGWAAAASCAVAPLALSARLAAPEEAGFLLLVWPWVAASRAMGARPVECAGACALLGLMGSLLSWPRELL